MLLEIIILITSIPVGLLLAYLCRDELVPGRKWFKLLSLVSLILALVFLLVYRKLEIILTLIYICITTLVSLYLSYNKKFVKL